MNYWNGFIEFTKQQFFALLLGLINVILIFITVLVNYLSLLTSRKANELQLLPLLVIYFRGTSIRHRKIRIGNISKNPAYNIKIESFIVIIEYIQICLSSAGSDFLIEPAKNPCHAIEFTSENSQLPW